MIYGERLEDLRNRIGISQKKTGELINLDSGTYSHYEKEDLIIPIKHLITLCNYFNVSLDYIFKFTDQKLYNNPKKEVNIEKYSERLKNFRKENKLTQKKLASILNTTQSVISDYEKRKRIIPTPFLYTISKKYNISADYLLGRTDSPKYLK